MADDPFPRHRVAATLRRMPAYLKLSWRLGRDPLLSKARRMAVIGAAGYFASPVDLVPGFLPVVGQLDDIAFALAALRFALAGLDAERRREHLEAVGLEDSHLSEDLRAVGAASAWMVRAGFRTTARVVTGGAHAAAVGVRAAGHVTSKAAPVARDAVTKGAPAALNRAAKAGPATREAVAKGIPAARDAATRGLGRIRAGMARRDSAVEVTVSRTELPALGPGPGQDEDPA